MNTNFGVRGTIIRCRVLSLCPALHIHCLSIIYFNSPVYDHAKMSKWRGVLDESSGLASSSRILEFLFLSLSLHLTHPPLSLLQDHHRHPQGRRECLSGKSVQRGRGGGGGGFNGQLSSARVVDSFHCNSGIFAVSFPLRVRPSLTMEEFLGSLRKNGYKFFKIDKITGVSLSHLINYHWNASKVQCLCSEFIRCR